MTVRQVLQEGAKLLEGVETPFLDALILLSHASGHSKEKLLASYPEEVSADAARDFRHCIGRRLKGIPVSYIRGKKEFYGLEFAVGPGVLVPRPETETLVEAVLGLVRESSGVKSVHDACTGTGCVAITIKHEMPGLEVTASDVSAEALSYFGRNSRELLREELPNQVSDLLSSVSGIFDVITANPPYVTTSSWKTMADRGWPEPSIALDGGPDGVNYYKDIIPQSVSRLRGGGSLFLEADPSQFVTIEKILMQNGFHTTIIYRDLAGRERVIRAEL